MSTITAVDAVFDRLMTLMQQIADFKIVLEGAQSIISEYPACTVSCDGFLTRGVAIGKVDFEITPEIWVYTQDMDTTGEKTARRLAEKVVDKLREDATFNNTVYDSGWSSSGFETRIGRAMRGNELPFAATITFTCKGRENK